jgi:hypothetical protein
VKIHNELPSFLSVLRKWKVPPKYEEFVSEYLNPQEPLIGVVFDDGRADFYSALADLDWQAYREEALRLDPKKEELRVLKHLRDVEKLFGFELSGEIVLFGSFATIDGYARFDRGTHRVFLGVDESHARGGYLDVLVTHELTHVARESRPEVWEGFGLDPKMTHDDFTEYQPVIEHLMGEGFSCVVSELLVPGEPEWDYAYQSEASLKKVMGNGRKVDEQIRKELLDPDGDYGSLYSPQRYGPGMPIFTQYVWAWRWVQRLLCEQAGGDPRKLVSRCSKDFIADALAFELRD